MSLPKCVILLLSGGLDSTTLLYDLHRQGVYVHSLIFDYGQRHMREVGFARYHCDLLKLPFTIVELHRIKGLFQHSALTDGAGSVIVPNRNAVFLNIAASIAMSAGAETVCIGCNADDAENFPDCTPHFIDAVQTTLMRASVPVEIAAPYINKTKHEIAAFAKAFSLEVEMTYSCYEGYSEPCGKCLACQKREEAFA